MTVRLFPPRFSFINQSEIRSALFQPIRFQYLPSRARSALSHGREWMNPSGSWIHVLLVYWWPTINQSEMSNICVNQSENYQSQGGERLVDVGSFLQSVTLSSGLVCSLWPCSNQPIRSEYCIVSSNQKWVLCCVNQSAVSMMLCQPIRKASNMNHS